MEKREFERAVAFLEANTGGSDAYSMWTRVADMALEHGNLFVAQRCFAAIGDVARARKLHVSVQINDSNRVLSYRISLRLLMKLR